MLIFAIAAFGLVIFSHMAPFPALLEAFRPSKSVWRMPADGAHPTVYLTFDDGPNLQWTPRVLDALAAEDATATFFLIDRYVGDDTAPIIRRIVNDGHAIGLHSDSRAPMLASPRALAEQLTAAADRITAISGQPPCRLFRPHAGWRSATMYEALESIDYRLAGWSWGMWDWNWWRRADARKVSARLGRKASAGDIIVIHDGHHRDPQKDRSHAGGPVQLIVPALRAKGFSFGRLCDP